MKTKIIKLLEETPEAYYWIGFIMADGCISEGYKKGLSLNLTLSRQDEKHFKKICNYLGVIIRYRNHKNGKKYPTLDIADDLVINDIKRKFDIHLRKTYNPPNKLTIKNDDLFTAFLIGFIDGDGHIRKNVNCLVVGCHYSWKNLLNEWFERLYKITNVIGTHRNIKIPKVRKHKVPYKGKDRFFAYIQTKNIEILKYLKDKAIQLKIPYLKRKWNNIIERKLIKQMTSTERVRIVKRIKDLHFNKGWSGCKISEHLKLYDSYTYSVIRRNL